MIAPDEQHWTPQVAQLIPQRVGEFIWAERRRNSLQHAEPSHPRAGQDRTSVGHIQKGFRDPLRMRNQPPKPLPRLLPTRFEDGCVEQPVESWRGGQPVKPG